MTTPPEVDVEQWLPEITRRIIATAHPAAIWLFGSRAHGSSRPDSDVDLLVVLPHLSETRHAHAVALRTVLSDIPVPKDLLVTSIEEFDAKRDIWGTIPYEAAAYGRILYAA